MQTGALDLVGPLIDAAIAAGANRVNSLDFNLRDDTGARDEAIAKAAKDAQAQAQALAAALGLKLGPIVSATTQVNPGPQPVMFRAAAMSLGANATPVSPAEVSVPATVSLTYQDSSSSRPAPPDIHGARSRISIERSRRFTVICRAEKC